MREDMFLTYIRECVAEDAKDEFEYSAENFEALLYWFGQLDEHLSNGGALPTDWERK